MALRGQDPLRALNRVKQSDRTRGDESRRLRPAAAPATPIDALSSSTTRAWPCELPGSPTDELIHEFAGLALPRLPVASLRPTERQPRSSPSSGGGTR